MVTKEGSSKTYKFTDEEAQKRFEAALKGALKTPHKPLKAKNVAKQPKADKEPGQ
jgi:hypothetical protein